MNDIATRISVRGQVISCSSCPLRVSVRHPVPFSGDNPNVFAILGEAPGREEDERGEPFVGPSGRLLRAQLGDYATVPSYLNTVCCFPNRTPNKKEIDACQHNLESQLSAIAPLYLMVCGGVALQSLGLDHRMGDAQGRWFRIEKGPWLLANWHPSAVLRAGLETKIGHEFVHNVGEYRETIREWDESRSTYQLIKERKPQLVCIRCARPAVDWDRNRTGWCDRHTWRAGVAREQPQSPKVGGRKRSPAPPASPADPPQQNLL